MGFLSNLVSGILTFVALVTFITFIPGIPHGLEFEQYSIKLPLPLQGPLSLKNKLDKVEKLFENEIVGPEHMEVHKGVLYTTLVGGFVVKVVNDKIVPVTRLGEDCDKNPGNCGRPLGLRFDSNGFLYAADAYKGVFKINITTGKYEQLVSMDTKINGKPPKLPNSLDIGSDGSVYWTDSCSSHSLKEAFHAFLANGNGRLLKYDPKSKKNTVLIDKIHFANGVVLSEDESFVLAAETFGCRIFRYNLKGPNKGKSEVFLDGLPGFPDNLHSNGNGEFYVTLVADVDQDYVLAALAPYPYVRKAIAGSLYLLQLPIATLNSYFPNQYAKAYINTVGNIGWAIQKQTRTTIMFFNKEGQITRSFHVVAKDAVSITDMALLDDMYYFGSYINPYMLRAKKS